MKLSKNTRPSHDRRPLEHENIIILRPIFPTKNINTRFLPSLNQYGATSLRLHSSRSSRNHPRPSRRTLQVHHQARPHSKRHTESHTWCHRRLCRCHCSSLESAICAMVIMALQGTFLTYLHNTLF